MFRIFVHSQCSKFSARYNVLRSFSDVLSQNISQIKLSTAVKSKTNQMMQNVVCPTLVGVIKPISRATEDVFCTKYVPPNNEQLDNSLKSMKDIVATPTVKFDLNAYKLHLKIVNSVDVKLQVNVFGDVFEQTNKIFQLRELDFSQDTDQAEFINQLHRFCVKFQSQDSVIWELFLDSAVLEALDNFIYNWPDVMESRGFGCALCGFLTDLLRCNDPTGDVKHQVFNMNFVATLPELMAIHSDKPDILRCLIKFDSAVKKTAMECLN